MSKIKTSTHLQSRLDEDFAWRIKEVSYLKSAVRDSESSTQQTLIRASVPILYAHWEGFVKNSVESFLEFLSYSTAKYNELQPCFALLGLKRHLEKLDGRVTAASIAVVDFLRLKLSDRVIELRNKNIDTESNLSSSVFETIAASIGLPVNEFETRFKLINESLLERRNKIAHGEYLDLENKSFQELSDSVLQLLRDFKTALENLIAQSHYKLPNFR